MAQQLVSHACWALIITPTVSLMGGLTDLPLELVDIVVQCSASKSFICFQYLTLL